MIQFDQMVIHILREFKQPQGIKVAAIDLGGTAIRDEVGRDGLPIMIDSCMYALEKVGISASPESVNEYRGHGKLEALYFVIRDWELQKPAGKRLSRQECQEKASEAYPFFIERGLELVRGVKEREGVDELFTKIREGKAYRGIITGYPDQITEALIKHLGWYRKEYIDSFVTVEQAGVGRPAPNIVNKLLQNARLIPSDANIRVMQPYFDYSCVLVLGDTFQDNALGNNLGTFTVITLDGTQTREKILSTGTPHCIVDHLWDVAGLSYRELWDSVVRHGRTTEIEPALFPVKKLIGRYSNN